MVPVLCRYRGRLAGSAGCTGRPRWQRAAMSVLASVARPYIRPAVPMVGAALISI